MPPTTMSRTSLALGLGLLAVVLPAAETPLGVRLDLNAVSRYMTHGFQVTDGPAIQDSLTVDATVPGLRFQVWQSLTVDRTQDTKDELDFRPMYSRKTGTGWRTVEVRGYLNYVVKPHTAAASPTQAEAGLGFARTSMWKFALGGALPNLLEIGPIASGPALDWFHWAPDPPGAFPAGTAWEPSWTTTAALPEPLAEAGFDPVLLKVWADYHSGAFGVNPGWSNIDVGLYQPVRLMGLLWRAGVAYQWSREATVAPRNVAWATFGAGLAF